MANWKQKNCTDEWAIHMARIRQEHRFLFHKRGVITLQLSSDQYIWESSKKVKSRGPQNLVFKEAAQVVTAKSKTDNPKGRDAHTVLIQDH